MEKEGLYGMAIAGGVIIGVASILGLSFAMVKKKLINAWVKNFVITV